MQSTKEQDKAAAKVVEVAHLLQYAINQAMRLGLKVDGNIWPHGKQADVSVRVYLEEELTVASTDEKRKKQ